MDKNMILTDEERKCLVKDKPKESIAEKIRALLSLKKVKIVILFVLGVIAIMMCVGLTTSDNADNAEYSIDGSYYGYMGAMDYCQAIEIKLQNVLSNIKGAGKVSVMVSVDGSPELVYASDTDEKVSNTNGGTTTTSSSNLIVVGKEENALILTENLPNVKGVIVVSTGASDVSVKLDILNAVSTLLDISIDKVSVLKGI